MSLSGPDRLTDLAGLASLDDPVRRRLYEYVSDAGRPVSREEAAEAAGITRTLAAYHLDKLAGAGLLATTYRRPAGRAGPGAGRPAKLYQQAEQELAVSVPPREYELLARLLAEAARMIGNRSLPRVPGCAGTYTSVARRTPSRMATITSLWRVTSYSRSDGSTANALLKLDGGIELRNCPFHRLAQEHRDLVCGLNLSLIEGVISGSARPRARAVLSPAPGRCCVVVSGG